MTNPAKEELSQLHTKLAAEIKRLRKERKIPQERFAYEIGVHRTYFTSIESGKRNISIGVLAKIAQNLDLKPSELLAKIEH